MLTPEYLNKCPEYFVQLYQELEDFILQDVARRIAKAGEITDTAQWQMLRLKELGMATKEIRQKITQINEMTLREINAVFQNAARESFDFEEKIYSKAGRKPIPLEENEALQALLSAAMQQTAGEMRNFTQSLGFMEMVNGKAVFRPIADVYQNTLDLMQMTVSTGAMDVKSAVRTATKRLMDSGVRTVDYASGWVNHVDVAARRAIVTGVNQLSAKMTDQLADDLGAEFFETTAHARARPSHQVWQGQVFHRGGAKDGYPDFESVTGLGTVGGLCGANCRHSYFPFFPGISVRAYSQKRLENIDPPPVTYNGKTYTAYESTQKQRQMETAMRKTKREMLGYEAAGLEEDFTSAAIKLKRQQEAYAEFSKAAGIHKQTERAQVVGFGHSQASRASWAYRKFEKSAPSVILDDKEKSAVLRYISGESYSINAKLRHKSLLEPYEKEFIKDLDSALNKFPKYHGTVIRDLTFFNKDSLKEFAKQHSVDNIVQYDAFTSSSIKEDYQNSPTVRLKIQSNSGRDLRAYNKEENEILFPRRVKFKVKQISLENGLFIVEMEEFE